MGIDVYIIAAANEYELCAEGMNCFDTVNGKYIDFNDYSSYRDFILSSRKLKNKRIERQVKYREKQVNKEIKRLTNKLAKRIADKANLVAKYGEESKIPYSKLIFIERDIDDCRRELKDLGVQEYDQ